MTTLKGLFDSKPRTQRNFLLENKREVKAKSTLNSQKNDASINLPLQKHKTSVNSLLVTSRPSTVLGSSVARSQNKHPIPPKPVPKSAQSLRKESSQNLQLSRDVSKSKELTSRLKSISSSRTVNYIDVENTPFEWTEVCPSLISHSICHQGVQTDVGNCEDLVDQLELIDCHNETDKAISQAVLMDNSPQATHDMSGRRSTDNTKSNAGLSFTVDDVRGTAPKGRNLGRQLHKEDSMRECHESEYRKNYTTRNNKSSPHASQSLSSKSEVQDDNSSYPASYQKGVIPKYLTKRKAEKASASAQAKEVDPNCPEGHVAMPDSERRETLDLILKSYNDLISELNRIPVRTDTLKMKQRKGEIEKQLDKLEEGIRVFSRAKVYVKLDA